MDKRYPWEQGLAVLPEHLRTGLRTLGLDRLSRLEEARLRRGFPMTALLPEGEAELDTPPVGEDELRQAVENATQSSAHTALDRVRQGFVTLRGGHRVGLCGSVVRKEGGIVTLRELSSLSVRVARSVPGLAGPLLPELTQDGQFVSTLILAPPGAGKTTLLRDLVRALSDGEGGGPLRVAVADERGEVAALWRGEPQLYVGRHTDVLDGCSKGEGLSILIRGMNPQAAAVDELGGDEDVRAAVEAQLEALPRRETARKSIEDNGKIIVTDSLEKAVEAVNRIAPEHLELCVDDPFALLPRIKNAGSIFLGRSTPEALGDYFAGPNHTLPTSGTARFSSPLGVDDFMKRSSFLYYDRAALNGCAEKIADFARREGLEGHARSALSRREGLESPDCPSGG